MERLYLVDGSGFIFRAYHALPPLTRPDGTPVGAVLGFVNMMLKLIDEFHASHLAVVFDAGRKTFRNEIYPQYKANRAETPEELIPQFSLIREACRAFHVTVIEKEGFEADDLIATYVKLAEERHMPVTVVSSDKDLMQLVRVGVELYDPMKNKPIREAEVLEKFGVGPEKVCDIQAMAGDSSDNIPGIPGIGPKTAAELIHTYGDLEGVLARAEEIKQPKRRQTILDNREAARISYQLVQLKADVPVDVGVDALHIATPNLGALLHFLEEQRFTSVVARLKRKFRHEDVTQFSLFEKTSPVMAASARLSCEEGIAWVKKWATPVSKLALSLMPAVEGGYWFGVAAQGQSAVIKLQEEETGLFLTYMVENRLLLIGHDIKRLMKLFLTYDLSLPACDDILVISYVLYNGRHRHDLSSLAAHCFGENWEMPTDTQEKCPQEALLIVRLHEALKTELQQERLVSVYERFDRPLLNVLARMELEGVRMDAPYLLSLSQEFAGRLQQLEQDIYARAGRQFNIASPKQLGTVLFEELKLSPGRKGGKTGAFVTSADVLEEMAAEGHMLPEKVLAWRQLAKLKNTYTDALPAQMNPETHHVHTHFSMTTTSTGRLSSSDPNLQNIPIRTEEGKKIRRAFIASPGCVLVSFDYSQIELRLLAHVAQIASLQDAFRKGIDIHQLTSSEVFGVPLEQVTPELRRRAKAINFGIIYGMSAYGLGRQLHVSSKEAGEYIQRYFLQYPGIQDYMKNTIAFAQQHGYVQTPWGRRCYIQGLEDKVYVRRQAAERQAINAPLQGGSADIMKKAMIAVDSWLQDVKLPIRLVLQVHDELLFDVPEELVETVCKAVVPLMEEVVPLSVPLKVDRSQGQSWS